MENRKVTLRSAVDVLLLIVTLSLVAIVGWRLARPPSRPATVGFAMSANDWKLVASSPRFMGAERGKVVIVEFVDYSCPYCKEAELVIGALAAEEPSRLTRIVRHFPSPVRPIAWEAAVVAECAFQQGRLAEMHAALFPASGATQKLQIDSMATVADIADLARFQACTRSEITKGVIEADVQMGRRLGLRGTPAFAVNGRLIENISPSRLRAYLAAILQ